MTNELDPKALAAAHKHGRLLRQRTIRNRVVAGVCALFIALAAILGYRDLTGSQLGSNASGGSYNASAESGDSYAAESDGDEGSEDEGDDEEEDDDDEGEESAAAPLFSPAPVVTQQS